MRKKMALMSVDEASMYLREVIYIPPHHIRLLAREGGKMHLLHRNQKSERVVLVLH